MIVGRYFAVLLVVCIHRCQTQTSSTDNRETQGKIRWDRWSSWSECSTDCGKGVMTRSRDCRSTVTGAVVDGCVGDGEEIKVCEETGCLREVTTNKECRKLQNRMFGGKRYRWEPYLHPSRPCELACRPLGAGFYLGLKMHVPDGTQCGENTPNICVQGVCMSVGCDGVVGSMAVQDRCGVCGGDGTSCKQIVRTFTDPLKFGYHTLTTIPSGATSIMITETKEARNYLAIKAADRTFQLNTMFRLSRFGDHPGGGTLFTYNRGTGPDCPDECITAEGPVRVPVDVLALVYEDSISVKVTYNIPSTAQEYTEKDELTSPQVQIDAGVIRTGTDEQVPDYVRSGPIFSHDFKFKKKHRHHKHGTTHLDKDFVAKSDYDVEKVYDNVANDGDIIGATGAFNEVVTENVKHDKQYTDKKTVGTNSNEILNNTVIQTNINENNITLQDNIPEEDRKIDNTVKTGTSSLQGVTVKTGVVKEEIEEEEVTIEDDNDGKAIGEDENVAIGEEEENVIKAEEEANGVEGEGEEEEEEEEDSDDDSESESDSEEESESESEAEPESNIVDETGKAEDEDEEEDESANFEEDNELIETTTSTNKPGAVEPEEGSGSVVAEAVEEEVDNNIPSLYSWSLTGYTQCSQTCGRGKQDPIIRCIVTDKLAEVDDSYCADLLKPEKTPKDCGNGPCPPSWKPGQWSKCSTTCDFGVQVRDYMCVREDGREVSSYECGSAVPRREERTCDMGSCNFGWYFTEWESECSALCGYGTVERQVTCISGTGNVHTACPQRDRPVSEKSCRNDECGGFWLTGPWSKCNATCGEAYQTRSVTCARQRRDRITVMSDYSCQDEEKPPTYMSCDLPGCGSVWFMSDWGECSVTCGSGQRSRDVRCLSADFRSGSGCDPNSKPADRESCTERVCPASDQPPVTKRPKKAKVTPANDPHCRDRFDQCRLVLQARLCSYQYYRKVCCRSCSRART